MSRFLSELLGAKEPMFHKRLNNLEVASGLSRTDIKLGTDIERLTRYKLLQLGFDPMDTTGTELYNALLSKISADDQILTDAIQKKYPSKFLNVAVAEAVNTLSVPKQCFAMKIPVARKLLQDHPPKQTIKKLGYRSANSLMRHETIFSLFTAAQLLEPHHWLKTLYDAYRRLTPADFEIRQLTVVALEPGHWQRVANERATIKNHGVVGLKELGAVTIMPLPESSLPAATITLTILTLNEINEVRAASTFLKYSQVQTNFGISVRNAAIGKYTADVELLQANVPWNVLQRYFSRYKDRYRAELFEPHIQTEDLCWHSVEKALVFLEPKLKFWLRSAHTGYLYKHQTISMNVIDAALNFYNRVPYEQRMLRYFRNALWQELLIRYMHFPSIEESVTNRLAYSSISL